MHIGDFASRQTARVPTQDGRFATDLIGSFSKAGQAAQAFLVQTPPGGVIWPHFHGSNQFQLFTGGSGKFGRHNIGVGSVHYADAYTPYGPIVSGAGGLDFLTLRQHAYNQTHYMPGARHERLRSDGSSATWTLSMERGEPGIRSAGTGEHDRPAVFDLDWIEGNEVLAAPSNAGRSGDAFFVVVRGAVRYRGAAHVARSCFYLDASELGAVSEMTAERRTKGALLVF
jgi:hypothetical protein